MEEYHTIPAYDDPYLAAEEDDVLSFWDSHPPNLCELLSSLSPPGDDSTPAPPEPAYHMWAHVQDVPVAGERHRPEGSSVTAVVPGMVEMPVVVASIWAPFAGPDCTACCVLRDVIHASDRCSLKLSIHGDLGFIQHALLVVHHFVNEIVEERYIADLSSLDAASVKQFLVDYGYCCYRDGQKLVKDTHRSFYDVLSVKMGSIDEHLPAGAATSLQTHQEDEGLFAALPSQPDLITEEAFHLPHASQDVGPVVVGEGTDKQLKSLLAALLWAVPELKLLFRISAAASEGSSSPLHLLLDSGEVDVYLQRTWGLQRVPRISGLGLGQSKGTAIGDHKVWMNKTGIAAQRERTGLLTFGDLARVFHLPITIAAGELLICTTALKKVCRRYHVYRWPHRKVLSAAKRIESMLESLETLKGEEAARTLCLLYAERRELRILYRVRV